MGPEKKVMPLPRSGHNDDDDKDMLGSNRTDDVNMQRTSPLQDFESSWRDHPELAWISDTGWQFARHPQFDVVAEKGDTRQTPPLRRHFCRGPHYEAFVQRLYTHVTDDQAPLEGPSWGRRRRRTTALPAGHNNRVLAVGNSHLRQTVYAWLTQLGSAVRRVTRLYHHYAVRVDLEDTNTTTTTYTTVYVLTNTHVPYAGADDEWATAILNLTQRSSLDDFDVIVVGNDNPCQPYYLERFARDFPNVSCDYHTPPTPADWIQRAHRSRLVFVTSFMGRHLYRRDVDWLRTVVRLRNHSSSSSHRVGFLYGRHHVEALSHEGSESDDDDSDVACPTCNVNGHRCVGAWGGHPDLVAWDLIEWLWTGRDATHPVPRPFVRQALDGWE